MVKTSTATLISVFFVSSRMRRTFIWRTYFPLIIKSPSHIKKKNCFICSVWKKFIEEHFNRPKIFLLYFYDAYDINLWEKKVWQRYGLFMQNKCLFMILWKTNRHSWLLNNSSQTFLNQWESIGFRKLCFNESP